MLAIPAHAVLPLAKRINPQIESHSLIKQKIPLVIIACQTILFNIQSRYPYQFLIQLLHWVSVYI